jgi:hypothetical protein
VQAGEVRPQRAVGKEGSIAGACDIEGVRTPEDLYQLFEVVVLDTLQLSNSSPRSSTMLTPIRTAMEIREAADFEERLLRLERVLRLQRSGGALEQAPMIELGPEDCIDAETK